MNQHIHFSQAESYRNDPNLWPCLIKAEEESNELSRLSSEPMPGLGLERACQADCLQLLHRVNDTQV